MRSSLSTLVMSSVAGGVLAAESALYHYMPVEFEYDLDSRVTANLTFGTAASAEPVKVVMDSGSANFWVWAPGAVVHWGSPYFGVVGPCNETVETLYDPALSPTSSLINQTSAYAYAGNSKIVSGEQWATDTITAPGGTGPISNIQFSLQTYGLLKLADNGSCLPTPYDKSILGLSPYTNNTVGPSFRQNLFKTGQVAAQTMFLWFDKHTGTLGDLLGGILFGAVDVSKYTGPLVEVPNVVDHASQVGIYVAKPNITLNGQTFTPDQTTTCLIDSGAHGDALPFDYTGDLESQFYAASAGQLVDYNGIVAFNGTCEDIPAGLNVTYTFAGVREGESIEIVMPVRNYARGRIDPYNDRGVCLLNWEMGGCILGAPFVSAAALLMDDDGDRIALAQGGVSAEGAGLHKESLVVLGESKSWTEL
ncbi:uncharacterized protein L3040_002714 [Drepanopeziza brunnea f. sp. 'multigermtubi']|nr:hypothetical protein L3040_002714 [Drepanopeziza brunnea f. sp. 'multigermtubi']